MDDTTLDLPHGTNSLQDYKTTWCGWRSILRDRCSYGPVVRL